MSLIMFEGFEGIYSTWLGNDKHWIRGGYGTTIPGIGRRSGYCLRMYANPAPYYVTYTLDDIQTSLVLGFALNPTSGGVATTWFMSFYNATPTMQFCIDLTTAGRLRIKDAAAGSVLAESADGAITFDIYQYVEIKFTCDGTDAIQVRVNGIDVIPITGTINLMNAGSGNVKKISFAGHRTDVTGKYRLHYDDMYLLNTSGLTFNNFLGDVKVDPFYPTSDGDYTQFDVDAGTDHWDAIDNIADDATDHYVEADTVGYKDSYYVTPTGDLPTILAVGIRALTRNSDAGVAEGTPFIRMDGVDYDQTPFEVGDTVEMTQTIILRRPDTDGVWSKTIIESSQFGWEFSTAS